MKYLSIKITKSKSLCVKNYKTPMKEYKDIKNLGVVAHACNSSYLEGKGGRIASSRPG
jgi:hypothetical protein